MINIKEKVANAVVALDEEMNMHLVETEEEALEFMKFEYSSNYRFYGLLPDPTSAYDYYKLKQDRPKPVKKKKIKE